MDGRKRDSVTNRKDRRKRESLLRTAPIIQSSTEYFITFSDAGFDKIRLRFAVESKNGNEEHWITLKDDEAHDISMILNEILYKRNIDIPQDSEEEQ